MVNVKLDKTKLICNISCKEHYKTITQFMAGACENIQEKGYTYWKKDYCTNCSYPLDANNVLFIRSGISQGKLYTKYDFNPELLSPEGWEQLFLLFSLMFDLGYHSFYKTCRLNYLEIAVDVPYIHSSETLVIDTQLKVFNDKHKSNGSIYLGAEKSARSIIVYDKKKQLKDKKNTVLDNEMTRIEMRLQPNLLLQDIQQLSNPFGTVRVFSLNNVKSIHGGNAWEEFKALLLNFDPQVAYLKLAPSERIAIQLKLQQACYSWWTPKSIWKSAIQKFEILKPPSVIY